jgi:AcrR family transcriptional regulator
MKCGIEAHHAPKGRTRDPEATRECLLQCAFQEIYEHGYAGASLDRILANSGVTKGALYHHFGSKADLANAVIDEVIRPFVIERWADPIRQSDDPITALQEHATEVMANFTDQEMACGCPLNNLIQELANVEERFRDHLARVCDEWRAGLAEAFERGRTAGTVREDVDPAAAAAFIVASVEGLATTMKSSRDREVSGAAARMFLRFLESLRPAQAEAPAA